MYAMYFGIFSLVVVKTGTYLHIPHHAERCWSTQVDLKPNTTYSVLPSPNYYRLADASRSALSRKKCAVLLSPLQERHYEGLVVGNISLTAEDKSDRGTLERFGLCFRICLCGVFYVRYVTTNLCRVVVFQKNPHKFHFSKIFNPG